MASTSLTRTLTTPTSDKIFTFSAWVKRSALGSEGYVFTIGSNGGSSPSHWYSIRYANEKIYVQRSGTGQLITNAVYRDLSAWYHIVLTNDTTQATDSNRIKLYVNGEQPSLGTATYPSQNATLDGINGARCALGLTYSGTGNYFDGSMAHINFIDGTAYDADTFGETDSLTGIWKPITSPSVTYGTNGFFLKFASSGSMGTDSSGNSNNFTVNGTLTQTQDTPSNVFATLNALENSYSSFTLSNGNLKAVTSNYSFLRSTLGVSAGKYYMEVKCTAQTGSSNKWQFGISDSPSTSSTNYIGANSYQYGWRGNANEIFYNGTTANYGSGAMATGDIIGMALDLDNNKIYWSINGTWKNSGDPAGNSNGFSITAPASTNTGYYHFAFGELEGTDNFTFETNFGNGYFGTTAVASAGTNASGIGIFEYDVPTGYTALSTKGLNL